MVTEHKACSNAVWMDFSPQRKIFPQKNAPIKQQQWQKDSKYGFEATSVLLPQIKVSCLTGRSEALQFSAQAERFQFMWRRRKMVEQQGDTAFEERQYKHYFYFYCWKKQERDDKVQLHAAQKHC